jgi:hypothetical protein
MQLGKEGKLTSLFLPPYSGNIPNAKPSDTPIHKISDVNVEGCK